MLRQREQHGDGAHFGDDDDARVGGAHEIADVDEAQACTSVDWGDDRGVTEDGARVFNRGLVGLDLRFLLFDQRLLRVDLLLGNGKCADLAEALEITLGIVEQRFVQCLLGDRLVELGLVGGGIDLRQDVPALDVLPFLEIDREYLAVDLRAHRDGVAGFGRADPFEPDGNVGDVGLGGNDGHRAVGARPAPPPAVALLASGRHVDCRGSQGADYEDGK